MKLNVQPPKTVLARSDEQIVYEISSHEWTHLKRLVDIISIIEPIHQNLATLFFGIFRSKRSRALLLLDSQNYRQLDRTRLR